MADLLVRKRTHFVLWRPRVTDPKPQLIIRRKPLQNPPDLFPPDLHPPRPDPPDLIPPDLHPPHPEPPDLRPPDRDPPHPDPPKLIPMEQNVDFPDLWELDARNLDLESGCVYYYWFEVRDSFPGRDNQLIQITDPFATTVDWRVTSRLLPPPYTQKDQDPAGVILFQNNELIPCDPDGRIPENLWEDDIAMTHLPQNNHLVIYELPTRWTRSVTEPNSAEVGVGTFRDVRALVAPLERREGAAPVHRGGNFEHLTAALRRGADESPYLKQLGVNALELLPPADSWQDREWGYGTSNFLAADFNLGFSEGAASPTSSSDLVDLVNSCHKAGIRFFSDVVMAFATRASYENLNYLDFHVLRGTNDPEEDARQDFGGKLMKYNYRVEGYDPISGGNRSIVPARQWMQTFLAHWMLFYRIDGIRMDSVANFNNWDFIQEFRDHAHRFWLQRWAQNNPPDENPPNTKDYFLVTAEELAVPLQLINEGRVDALWNEGFKHRVREVILGGRGLSNEEFSRRVEDMVDCTLRLGFHSSTQAVNYITSHDVEGSDFRNARLYNFLHQNGVIYKEKQIKLAFVFLLTSVGVPMILAGEEFGDEHDLPTFHPHKQMDPVNFHRKDQDLWRKRVFKYVAKLVRFRVSSNALAVKNTHFLHYDFTPGRRVMAWQRGDPESNDRVVVVANCSPWQTETAQYQINNWPHLPENRIWREITHDRGVPEDWAGKEPLYPWEAKVYEMVEPRVDGSV